MPNKKTRFQDGIFYKKRPVIPPGSGRNILSHNSTFAILFLRSKDGSSAQEIKKSLEILWKFYASLKRRQQVGSVLIGYGPRIFRLDGVKRAMPENLKWQFLPPSKLNRSILEGCGIKFSEQTQYNPGISEDVVIQIISNTQLETFNAIVETSKHVNPINNAKNVLNVSRFFTGFQRDDGRTWLGFHDEISNLSNERERTKAIFIEPEANDLRPRDYWTRSGTYMVFIRMEIDLSKWETIDRVQQECIVGRRKRDGMPLIGIDKRGTPVAVDKFKQKASMRTVLDHPDYFNLRYLPRRVLRKLDIDASVRILTQSHVGRTRHLDAIPTNMTSSRRIFRQSFEFIEPLYESEKAFRLGTNFVSFQTDPRRLFFILTDPNWMGGSNFGGESGRREIPDILSVLAAGVFYVPPLERPFPGESIFS